MTKNATFKKWFTFVVLVIGGGTVFKLSSLRMLSMYLCKSLWDLLIHK